MASESTNEAFGVSRFRKDWGDLKELASSMEEYGQLVEILKTSDGITIDGDRREAAFKEHLEGKSKKVTKLREYRIPFTWKELEETGLFSLMQVEANTQRKGFTIEEINNIKKYIEQLRKSGNLPERFKGTETVEIVGKITHTGSRNVRKIGDIMESIDEKKLDSKYIKKINQGSTSINTVHKMATREKRSLPKVEIPKGEYDCVLIDFPIQYDSGAGIRGSADNSYPTLTLEECIEQAEKFPIADNAIIFLWITKPMKFDRPAIQYKREPEQIYAHSTQDHLVNSLKIDCVKDEFVWIKDKFGNGNYTRSQHEYLLICFKGKTIVPAKAFSSVIDSPVREHSSKPEVWNMIKKMYPKRKYFECYRRDITDGVDGFGNQTRGVDFGGKTDKVTIVTMEDQGDKIKVVDVKQMSPIEKLRKKQK